MLKKIFIAFIFTFAMLIVNVNTSQAQCSMCTINAEQGTQNGNTQANGINDGVLYLLALPYLLIAGVGIVWYRNYKKKLEKPTVPNS